MSSSVLLAVLVSAMLHASWNVMVKSSPDKTLDTALIHLCCSLIAIPFCLVLGLPSAESLPYLAASVLTHIGYYFALAQAYHHGELGLARNVGGVRSATRGLVPKGKARPAVRNRRWNYYRWSCGASACLTIFIRGSYGGILTL